MDRHSFFCLRLWFIVNSFAQNVENSAQCFLAYRHCDSTACIHSFCATNKTICRCHSDTSYHVIAKMLSYFNNQFFIAVFNSSV